MKTIQKPRNHKTTGKEDAAQLKTIHDLPKEMREMYGITAEHESINNPIFIGLSGKSYTMMINDTTCRIERENKCIIHLWVKTNHIHITVL